ncbi:cupin domain-containing protein [Roseateles koreensis]|uniref:Cupin domain-containing protein n=1 Tax=Roseateles koreensis TaxID=2987526 RepID=A0ABT5KWS9_9BURK|nr:cupin domain-containing protein [Roseateles koreensis]MDC8786803.1 cupin domain-containing protein [Roseateles koreensis]
MPVYKVNEASAERSEYYLSPEKLLSGNPKQTLWMQYTDPTKKFVTGVWHSEVGKWKIQYTEEEYCHMLDGISIITDASGCAITVSAGESFVVPRGFVGTWEVITPSKKTFVIYEPGN